MIQRAFSRHWKPSTTTAAAATAAAAANRVFCAPIVLVARQEQYQQGRCFTSGGAQDRAAAISVAGSHPLHLFQQECQARGFCNDKGQRQPNVDWRIVLASSSAPQHPQDKPDEHDLRPPNLRTVGLCRVSTQGLDFVVAKTKSNNPSPSLQALLTHPVSMLHSRGHFLPGHMAEQWRFEGPACVSLDLSAEEILQQVPPFTIISLLGSYRLAQHEQEQPEQQQQQGDDNNKEEKEANVLVSPHRVAMGTSKSHLVEVMQTIRQELEQNQLNHDELLACLRPLRLQPTRVECMLASPDASIMWDRWEWLHDQNDEWYHPQQLVPH
ncbi:hypothetical protein ACA910_002526 [Epithemia clementina (nom. ined.)]